MVQVSELYSKTAWTLKVCYNICRLVNTIPYIPAAQFTKPLAIILR